jgi:hypothetical protein
VGGIFCVCLCAGARPRTFIAHEKGRSGEKRKTTENNEFWERVLTVFNS